MKVCSGSLRHRELRPRIRTYRPRYACRRMDTTRERSRLQAAILCRRSSRIEELIAEYNVGSLNIDEYLRRLVELSRSPTDEEQRAVVEGLTEEELAIFDLLTKPASSFATTPSSSPPSPRSSALSAGLSCGPSRN